MTSRRHPQAANWEPPHPQKPASRYGIPAIYLNLEVGLSFSEENKTHRARMKYASKKMEDKLHEQRLREQYEEGRYSVQHGLLPNRKTLQQQQQRQRRLGVNTREQHERGTSAPPTTMDRASSYNPGNPATTMLNKPSMALDIPADRTSQALPPTPSRFRLGDADMPWCVEPIFISELETPIQPYSPSQYSPSKEDDTSRLQDAKEEGDLEALHLAMMTVDGLEYGAWEPPTWATAINQAGGRPASVGWAVRSDELSPSSPRPPSYASTVWDPSFTLSPMSTMSAPRPRTAGA